MMSAQSKLQELGKLEIDEKIALINELWVDVVKETEATPISAELAAELDKRVASYKANPDLVYSMDEVLAEIRKEHNQ